MLKIDGHDDAVIGPASIWRNDTLCDVLVYDGEKIVENLMKDGMTREEALEYVSFNIEGAYVGDSTPVIAWPNDVWDQE